jgi:hypothetical protein
LPTKFHLVARTGHPTFLDLPWEQPLEEWEHERLVEVVRGIHRHVVRFVNYEGALYALKELPERLAQREYRLLRALGEQEMPVVDVVGVVSRDKELESVLITRLLDFSLPYRSLFSTGRGIPDLRTSLINGLAELLVRLHLAGFYWGDCSLSNALFRRDAGALNAYLVDAETGELHPTLSDGQRLHDLRIAQENLAGELFDVEAAGQLPQDIDPIEQSEEVAEVYDALWTELMREEVFALDERFKIDERLRRLNELGFDVEEIDLASGVDGYYRLRLDPKVVEPGHHRRRLLMLTGLDVQENQARRLLNDLAGYRACLEQEEGTPLPESVVAYKWLSEVFEPTIAAIPTDLRGKLEPAELFHEILDHRWYLSEREKKDVGLETAVESYVEEVLRTRPSERTPLFGGSPPTTAA